MRRDPRPARYHPSLGGKFASYIRSDTHDGRCAVPIITTSTCVTCIRAQLYRLMKNSTATVLKGRTFRCAVVNRCYRSGEVAFRATSRPETPVPLAEADSEPEIKGLAAGLKASSTQESPRLSFSAVGWKLCPDTNIARKIWLNELFRARQFERELWRKAKSKPRRA
jgi:hypothetical protein